MGTDAVEMRLLALNDLIEPNACIWNASAYDAESGNFSGVPWHTARRICDGFRAV